MGTESSLGLLEITCSVRKQQLKKNPSLLMEWKMTGKLVFSVTFRQCKKSRHFFKNNRLCFSDYLDVLWDFKELPLQTMAEMSDCTLIGFFSDEFL